MKKVLLSLLVMSALVLSVIPGVLGTTNVISTSSALGITINTERFTPLVWECDSRVVYDDGTEPGRISEDGTKLVERMQNYAFEGEQIEWKVLVMDKNGIDKVKDVYVTVDGDIEANCDRLSLEPERILGSCNAKIEEEKITTFNRDLMAYYLCKVTIETPESMYGPSDITVEAVDLGDSEEEDLIGVMDEGEHWYLNPVIELSVLPSEGIVFGDEDGVRPGTSSYSNMVTIGNDADPDSGVVLDMFISGTDFYDSRSSGAKCGTSNVLELKNFRYYSANGAYSTYTDPRADSEGYVPIKYGIGFNDPKSFYNANEIMQVNKVGPYYLSNLLTTGAEMSLTFRLDLPEPCNGDFDDGKIYFWGEAV